MRSLILTGGSAFGKTTCEPARPATFADLDDRRQLILAALHRIKWENSSHGVPESLGQAPT